MSIGFLVAFAGSIVLMLVNFVALQMKASSQESVAAVVNVSGRERMLSQRIALLARELALAKEQAEQARLRKDLIQAITLFDQPVQRLLGE